MKKVLAVNIGNTNITSAVFSGGGMRSKKKAPTFAYASYRRILSGGFDEAIISSVVPVALARFLCEMKRSGCSGDDITVLGMDRTVPIKNLCRVKSEVGQDRLVNAFGASAIYGTPAVIIDFGTAITFNIVSRNGSYLGGLILPGLEMGLKSLYDRTALLPKVGLKPARCIIGRDTAQNMRGGILFGYGAMCDGLVSAYRKVLGPGMKVVATGGNAKLMSRYAKSIRKVDEDLALKSLALLAGD